MATVVFEDQFEIPDGVTTLSAFRRWALSPEFPERGRIDFIDGRIEIDMSPEDFFTHGTLKAELCSWLVSLVKERDLGYVVTDRTRVSSPEANLSAEPDIVFISHDSLDSGQVQLVPKASGEPGRYVEVEGGPDLVIEIVSDSSKAKDIQRLPTAYYNAGVGEYWLIDARKDQLEFVMYRQGDNDFEQAVADSDGLFQSRVLSCEFKLDRERDRRGHWKYDVIKRD
jgi:Uma2 family endonuclease